MLYSSRTLDTSISPVIRISTNFDFSTTCSNCTLKSLDDPFRLLPLILSATSMLFVVQIDFLDSPIPKRVNSSLIS